jgi:hypothetical protein
VILGVTWGASGLVILIPYIYAFMVGDAYYIHGYKPFPLLSYALGGALAGYGIYLALLEIAPAMRGTTLEFIRAWAIATVVGYFAPPFFEAQGFVFCTIMSMLVSGAVGALLMTRLLVSKIPSFTARNRVYMIGYWLLAHFILALVLLVQVDKFAYVAVIATGNLLAGIVGGYFTIHETRRMLGMLAPA